MTRRLAAAGAAAVLATVLAGCGDEPSDGTDGPGDTGHVERIPGNVLLPDVAALSPDGDRLAVPCPDQLCVWDTATGDLAGRHPGGAEVAWSPDGSLLATTEVTGGVASVVLLDAGTGEERSRFEAHDVEQVDDAVGGGILDLAFSPDGTTIATAADDGTVRLWSVGDGAEQAVLEQSSATPDDLAFSPDGGLLAVAAPDEPVGVWDLTGEELVGTLGQEPQGQVVFSPEGDRLATATNAADDTATLRTWDAATLEEADRFPEPVQADGIAFSPDGRSLALSQKDEPAVLVWSVGGGEVQRLVGHEEPPRAVLWAPSGETLYSVGTSDGVLAWDVAHGEVAQRFELPGA